MAAKRRRRRARKRAHNPRPKGLRRKKRRNPVRAVAANPHKRRRVRRANPRRHVATRKRRRNPVRAVMANPRRHSRRRHRRNPGIPVWAMAAIGAALGLAGYAVANAGTMAITKALDPSLETLSRNRYIAGGVLTVGGLALAALVSPALGVGLASAGAVALVGSRASQLLIDVVTPAEEPKKKAMAGLGSAASLRQLTGGMGAVQSTMGALEVGAAPPWARGGNPF